VPRLVCFLVSLPYPRITCLVLAAVQLMPLPDERETQPGPALGIVTVVPDPWSQRPPLEGGMF